jgi:hypothetical protein
MDISEKRALFVGKSVSFIYSTKEVFKTFIPVFHS